MVLCVPCASALTATQPVSDRHPYGPSPVKGLGGAEPSMAAGRSPGARPAGGVERDPGQRPGRRRASAGIFPACPLSSLTRNVLMMFCSSHEQQTSRYPGRSGSPWTQRAGRMSRLPSRCDRSGSQTARPMLCQIHPDETGDRRAALALQLRSSGNEAGRHRCPAVAPLKGLGRRLRAALPVRGTRRSRR